jgi:hypothetical protein
MGDDSGAVSEFNFSSIIDEFAGSNFTVKGFETVVGISHLLCGFYLRN